MALKLFGSAEDKKLANIVADWVKGKPVSVEIDSGKEHRDHVASGVNLHGVNLPNGFKPYAKDGMFMNPSMFNSNCTPFLGGLPLRLRRGLVGLSVVFMCAGYIKHYLYEYKHKYAHTSVYYRKFHFEQKHCCIFPFLTYSSLQLIQYMYKQQKFDGFNETCICPF